jgi:hypothetical protein
MCVALLGPLEVSDDAGLPVDVPGARLRALLSRLALEPGRAVGTGALIDAVWADPGPVSFDDPGVDLDRVTGPEVEAPPAGAANALQTLVSPWLVFPNRFVRPSACMANIAPVSRRPLTYRAHGAVIAESNCMQRVWGHARVEAGR